MDTNYIFEVNADLEVTFSLEQDWERVYTDEEVQDAE